MRTTRVWSVLLAVGAWVLLATAQPLWALDGNEWMRFPGHEKRAYVMGVVDTWQMIKTVVRESERDLGMSSEDFLKVDFTAKFYGEVTSCLNEAGMSYGQITGIVETYMTERREHWQYSMPSNVWSALTESCRKR